MNDLHTWVFLVIAAGQTFMVASCMAQIAKTSRRARQMGLTVVMLTGIIGVIGWVMLATNRYDLWAILAVGIGLLAEYGFIISTAEGRSLLFWAGKRFHAGWAGRLALSWPVIASPELKRVARKIAQSPAASKDPRLVETLMEIGETGTLIALVEASDGQLLEKVWPRLSKQAPEQALNLLQQYGRQVQLSEELLQKFLKSNHPRIRQAGLRASARMSSP